MIEQIPDLTNKFSYIKLGTLKLQTKKEGYKIIKDHEASKLITSENESQINQKIVMNQCQIRVQSNPQKTWQNTYKLVILCEKTEYQKQEMKEMKQINQEIQIDCMWSKTSLINLVQMQHLKLYNPKTISEPQLVTNQMNFNAFYQTLYLSNAQNSFCYNFTVQAWVNIKLLQHSTLEYKKIEKQFYSRCQSGQQLSYFLFFRSKKEDQYQKPIAQLLMIIQSIVKSNKTQEIRNQLKYVIPLQINHHHQLQQCDASVINPLLGTKKDQTQLQSNSIIPFNFSTQGNQIGLYFDLDPQLMIESPIPTRFNGQLKSYQSFALTWLLYREGQNNHPSVDDSHIPFWQDQGKLLNLNNKLLTNNHLNYVMWNQNVIKKCNGGILADQMGLGKTIMMIALILAHKPSVNCQTLIVAPLSVVKQWKTQLSKFAPSLNVLVNKQTILTHQNLKSVDVVITSEGKLRYQVKKQQTQNILLDHQWFRVIVDEAHNFKNSKTQMAKSIYNLKSKYRWCLTGTPAQNSVSDLYSLIKFLRFYPWCIEQWWNSQFPKDVKKTTSNDLVKMKNLLKGILLRRKKQSVDLLGNHLLSIPKAVIKVHIVKLNEEAKYVYQCIDYKAQNYLKQLQALEKKANNSRISKYLKNRLNQAKKLNFTRILSLMTKMRMICCHQFLSTYRSQYILKQIFMTQYIKFLAKKKICRFPKYNFFQEFLANPDQKQQLKKASSKLNKVYQGWDQRIRDLCNNSQSLKCKICQSQYQNLFTPCLHVFCKFCIEKFIVNEWMMGNNNIDCQNYSQSLNKKNLKDFQSHCPQCNDSLKLSQLFDLPRINQFNRPFSQFHENEKLNFLLGYLKNMKQNDKALIFTSFLGMMTLIAKTLQKVNIKFQTIKGNDDYELRHKKIQQFNTSKNHQVLILTLKTGSVGLNMEAANKVFFMDPWWNPAIQQQAICRVHRFGQTKQVQAIKFITESTIEARILKLSLLKKQMSDSILDIDDVVHNKTYSKTRKQMTYLLSVQQEQQNDLQESIQRSQTYKIQ